MSASCLALATVPGGNALSGSGDLTQWHRFLQSEPLGGVVCDADPSVAVVEPIAQTLHQLTWNWMTVSLVGTWATTSAALLAFSTLANIPPSPDCAGVGGWSTPRAGITCLQTAIAAGDVNARSFGLAWVGQWDTTHPLFHEGTDLLEAWSIPVLHEARQAHAAGQVVHAMDLAIQVPATSPRFEAAQALLTQLKQTQQAIGQTHYDAAQRALADQRWDLAQQHLADLQALDHDLFKTGLTEPLAQQIEVEQQGHRLWQRAIQQHAFGTPEDQAYAIAIASQIDSNTYLWPTAQPLVNQWSDALFPLAQARLEQGDINGAIALAQQIAKNPDRQAVTQDWLALAWAEKLAAVSLDSTSPYATPVGLYPALLSSQSLHPESAWQGVAQSQARRWQAHLVSAVVVPSPCALPLTRHQALQISQQTCQHSTLVSQSDHPAGGKAQPWQPLFSHPRSRPDRVVL
jgi:hypothetical protein